MLAAVRRPMSKHVTKALERSIPVPIEGSRPMRHPTPGLKIDVCAFCFLLVLRANEKQLSVRFPSGVPVPEVILKLGCEQSYAHIADEIRGGIHTHGQQLLADICEFGWTVFARTHRYPALGGANDLVGLGIGRAGCDLDPGARLSNQPGHDLIILKSWICIEGARSAQVNAAGICRKLKLSRPVQASISGQHPETGIFSRSRRQHNV